MPRNSEVNDIVKDGRDLGLMCSRHGVVLQGRITGYGTVLRMSIRAWCVLLELGDLFGKATTLALARDRLYLQGNLETTWCF